MGDDQGTGTAAAAPPAAAAAPGNGSPPAKPEEKGPVFSNGTVSLNGLTFKLRSGVTLEQLLTHRQASILAGEAYSITLSAIDRMQDACGDSKDLIGRIRQTLHARTQVEAEIEALADCFADFYQPPGIRKLFDTNEKFTELVNGTIESLLRKE